jgi:oxygen-dependent protoporphyrinogen oxidase
MPQYVLGHLERLEALQAHLARLPGLYLTGSAYGGVGLPDGVRAGMQTAAAVWHHLTG